MTSHSERAIVLAIEAAREWIAFDPKRHRYSVRGVHTPSVTTILDVLAKPALIGWAARMQREADMRDIRAALGAMDMDAVAALAAVEATPADAHRRVKETAADLGTEVHRLIESWCLRRIGVQSEEPGVSEDAAFVFAGWEEWAEGVRLTPLVLEGRIAHSSGYAGTFDFLGYADDVLVVADWKSSARIYGEMELQVVAYAKAVEEIGGVRPIGLLVRLPKNEPGAIEPHWVRGDYDELFAVFSSLISVYHWRKGG